MSYGDFRAAAPHATRMGLLIGLAVTSLVATTACGDASPRAGQVEPDARPPDKAEFSGKADAAAVARWCKKLGEPAFCDICDVAGWYNDGSCESFCPRKDLDCQALEDRFKYGTIGSEAEGIPYWVWQALPRAFPELLPATGAAVDYSRFGFHYEAGHAVPVGFSKQKQFGRPLVVATNCAACHSGTYRLGDSESPRLVLGAPAHGADLQRYVRFLQAAAAQPDFVDRVSQIIESISDLNAVERVAYRAVVRATQKGIRALDERYAWTTSRPDWGPGRIDPFNPVKFHHLDLDPGADSSVGNSDMTSLWMLSPRALHWDGLNRDVREVVLSSAIGTGASEASLPVAQLAEIQSWLSTLEAPGYPFSVDPLQAEQGRLLFAKHCAECHGSAGPRTGTVVPIAEVGTDGARLTMWTQQAADRYNAYVTDPALEFSNFRKTDGYVAVPLDGLWMRAPYLHNGSVPTLADLLQKTQERPTAFWRGSDIFDPERVGYQASSAATASFFFDTSVFGNGNHGHEYGAELTTTDKLALLEYLKTL